MLSRNQRAVEAFLANQTQWIFVPMGGRAGLNHNAVRGRLEKELGMRRKQLARTMDKVRLIEYAALDEWDRQAKRDKAAGGH